MRNETSWGPFPTEEAGERADRWFCPSCRKPRRSPSGLCPECGDRLDRQGYCGVCHDHWPLAAGEPCPKHELPLEADRPGPPPLDGIAGAGGWASVASFALPYQAEAARLRLDAEGIPAILDGERMGTTYGAHLATGGGIRVQVPRPMLQDARVLLSQSWAGPDDPEDEDEEIDWDEVSTVRDEVGGWRTSLLFWGVVLSLAVVAAGLLGLASG